MPNNVARIGDQSSIFYGCSPDFAVQGSTDTFVNGLGVHRRTDMWSVHCCSDLNCYNAYLLSGAFKTYVNGLNVGRVGDPIIRYMKISGPKPYASGMATVATGSPDTFVGGGGGGGPSPGITYFRAGTARAGDYLSTQT